MKPLRIFSLLAVLLLLAALLCGCSGRNAAGQSAAGSTAASASIPAPGSAELSALSGLLLDGTGDRSALPADTAALYEQLCSTLMPYLVTQCGSGYKLFLNGSFSQEDYLLFLNLCLQQNCAQAAAAVLQNESGQPVWYFERDFYAEQYAALSPLAGALPDMVASTEIGGTACIAAPEMGWGGTCYWEIESAAWTDSGELDISMREHSTETDESVLIRFTLQPAGERLCFLSAQLPED